MTFAYEIFYLLDSKFYLATSCCEKCLSFTNYYTLNTGQRVVGVELSLVMYIGSAEGAEPALVANVAESEASRLLSPPLRCIYSSPWCLSSLLCLAIAGECTV